MKLSKFVSTAIILATVGAVRAMASEEAEYKVIKAEKNFEIREYAPHILAEVVITGSLEEAGNQAFRPLFKYISGDNTASAKVAMTAPVSQQAAGEKIAMTAPVSQQAAGEKIAMTAPVSQQAAGDQWAVSFMMPAAYTLATIPRPTNPAVQLRQVPARRMAAIRYAGFWSEKRYRKHLAQLEEWLQKKSLTAAGTPVWARYNPPFTPWFMRRNEILIPLTATPFRPEFYAFQNGVAFGPPSKEAAILKELGYAGVSQVKQSGEALAALIQSYDHAGLRVLSVYLNVNDAPLTAEQLLPLANRNAMLELTVTQISPGTVAAVRQTAELAAGMNIRAALYPHSGFAVARMDQAMELIEKVDHPNLGVMFNLCHFLKSEDPATLESVLLKAGNRLFAVSTSGADTAGTEWNALIQPLNQGDFPQKRLFATLQLLNFQGPVALQCYGVKGDKKDNLEKSMTAWRAILDEL